MVSPSGTPLGICGAPDNWDSDEVALAVEALKHLDLLLKSETKLLQSTETNAVRPWTGKLFVDAFLDLGAPYSNCFQKRVHHDLLWLDTYRIGA
jgi:hypothetical protein